MNYKKVVILLALTTIVLFIMSCSNNAENNNLSDKSSTKFSESNVYPSLIVHDTTDFTTCNQLLTSEQLSKITGKNFKLSIDYIKHDYDTKMYMKEHGEPVDEEDDTVNCDYKSDDEELWINLVIWTREEIKKSGLLDSKDIKKHFDITPFADYTKEVYPDIYGKGSYAGKFKNYFQIVKFVGNRDLLDMQISLKPDDADTTFLRPISDQIMSNLARKI